MWAQVVSALLGVWLMAAPAALGYGDPARTNDRIVGPIVASLAVVAIWEVTRGLRWVNVVCAAWLLVAPWVLGEGTTAAVNSVAVGSLLLALAFVGGSRRQRFGGGWASLWREPERPARSATRRAGLTE
jgi:hypothetical protein